VPGRTNPAVTQSTLHATVCMRGWTATVRPPTSYTDALKLRQLRRLGYHDTHAADYEEDHLVSLELGGSPRSPLNLWPQPWAQARRDDRLENRWHRQLCSGALTLRQARRAELAWKHVDG
jgi:hypothetical protein